MKERAQSKETKNPLGNGGILIFCLVIVCIIVAGVWFYIDQARSVRQEVEADLSAIAELKADQIISWRAERLADAGMIQGSPFLVEAIDRWLSEPEAVAEKLTARLRSIKESYGYHNILIVDTEGKVKFSLGDHAATLHGDAVRALAVAFREKRPVLTDLYAGPGDLLPHCDAVAPLFVDTGEAARPIGAVILQSDARNFLYPLIKSWPRASRSAETLLVRREGDSLLYLNELRHQKGTALTLKIPLDRRDLPAVRAALGEEGIFDGHDYRGVDVLAVLKAIPDSPWFMVAKMDKAEALSGWRLRSVLILSLILGLIIAAAFGAAMVRQREQRAQYAALYEAEAALGRSEERYRMTLLSVGDGILTTDKDGRVELMNPVAERLTGWKQEEALSRPIGEVFQIINEKTRLPVESPIARVLREGVVVGLANHSLLISRDGGEHAIADAGAPIRDKDGAVVGVVLVFRDQTAERAALRALLESRDALRESEEKYRTLVERANDGIAFIRDGVIIYANPRLSEIWGGAIDEVIGTPFADYLAPECVSAVVDRYQRRMAGEDVPAMFETTFIRKDGSRMDAEVNANLVMHKGKPADLVFIRDVTERKRAEEELRKERTLLRTLIDALPDYIFIKDSESRFITANSAHLRAIGAASLDDVVGKTDFELFPRELAEKYYADEQQVIQSGRPLLDREERVVEHSGTEKWILTTKVPLRDDQGRVAAVVGISRDITTRKLAEEELAHSEERLNAIFESAPDALYLSDFQGKFINGNNAAEEIIGLKREDLIGSNFLELNLLPPDQASRAAGLLARNLNGEATGPDEFTLNRPDGRQVVVEISTRPVKIKGEQFVLGIARDITKRKAAEEKLKTALQEREVLLREIHHRVKNNIQIISSLLRLQSRYVKDDKALEILNESQSRIKSMALIHEKLYQSQDFARIDFTDYIDKMITHLFAIYKVESSRIRFKVEAKNIQLDINRAIPCGLIINELITNALKHAFPDDREGEVDVRMSRKDDDRYELVIKDNGVGLPGDIDLNKTKTLGFQIVRDLVKQLGGSLEIRKGDGTEIIIQL
ncbi:MAG: PAS domain S-box protein [Candidatus Aminicenantales bacterium]